MFRLLLFVTALLSVTLALAQSDPAPKRCPVPPAIAADFPDPSILYDPASGQAFAYGTNIFSASGALLNVPVTHTGDAGLESWSPITDAMPKLPGWARPSYTWAPAIAHRQGGPYRLYFTARYGESGLSCIGVAVSQTPAGPFAPTSETTPVVCPLDAGGAIDPSVFRDDDGAEYLLWKTDSNCCDRASTLHMQRLSQDGLSLVGRNSAEAPWRLPDAAPLIHVDQPWEGGVIEGPTLRKHRGQYYLFYSAGRYATTRYAVGYATSASLFGPYKKAVSPILSASASLQGPGGPDVFSGANGSTWIAFHAWRQSGGQRFRALHVGRIVWRRDGPIVMTQCLSGTAGAE